MDEIVRENFKRFRKKINITQEQMAEYLELEQSSISKFENGERTITLSNLEKACSLFGVNISDMFKKSDIFKVLSPSFRKTGLSLTSLEDISFINKIALNILEMDAILEKRNG
mgnify:CR=1 FL=1